MPVRKSTSERVVREKFNDVLGKFSNHIVEELKTLKTEGDRVSDQVTNLERSMTSKLHAIELKFAEVVNSVSLEVRELKVRAAVYGVIIGVVSAKLIDLIIKSFVK